MNETFKPKSGNAEAASRQDDRVGVKHSTFLREPILRTS